MAIDTPARLAILGAGPIGLEAALYARFLGYDVIVYERGEVAEAIRMAMDAPLSAPFKAFRTSLGLAALQAQDENFRAPPDDAILTCHEWRERYLLPLAATDLLSEHLRLQTTVTAVEFSISEAIDNDDEDGIASFRVTATSFSGKHSVETFDGILDCTGLADNPSWAPADSGAEYFHILGSKAFGTSLRAPTAGYDQIRTAFATIGDRPALDLYASSAHLLH